MSSRENDERINEEDIYQEELQIFGLNNDEEESKNKHKNIGVSVLTHWLRTRIYWPR